MRSQADTPLVVVVAEDEPIIRMWAVEVLADEGFIIHEAHHAAHAVALLESKAGSVHVLFTDVHMPGEMNGLELARHVAINWPWIGIVVTSAMLDGVEVPAKARFLAKPYEGQHLVDHVRQAVA